MMDRSAVIELLGKQKILPLFYHPDAEVCASVLQSLYEAGIRMVEFTNRGSEALVRFKEMSALCSSSLPGMRLAVGTVSTGAHAEVFLHAGADLLISPFWDDGVADVARSAGVVWVPGCMTPTEIHRAADAGLGLVKLFPGNVLGTGFVEAVRPVFPGVSFVVTGGVDATVEGVGKWLKAGVVAAGLGSRLIPADVLQKRGCDGLVRDVSLLVDGLKD